MTFRRVPLRNGYSGFSLIEMAVVLIIASVLLGMGISMLGSVTQSHNISTTRDKQNAIKDAAMAYLAREGHLPCPASPAALSGAEDLQSSTPRRCNNIGAAGAVSGIVPYQTLNLGQEAALDGWGNFFTYTIFADWAISAPSTANPVFPNLVLQERAPGTAATTTSVANAAMTLVSHGANGYGAWTSAGTINQAPTAGTDEAVNTAHGLNVITRAINTDASATGGAYDDVVTVASASDLLMPLYRSGSLQSPDALARQALARVHMAIVAGTAAPSLKSPWGGPVVVTTSGCAAVSGQLFASIDYFIPMVPAVSSCPSGMAYLVTFTDLAGNTAQQFAFPAAAATPPAATP